MSEKTKRREKNALTKKEKQTGEKENSARRDQPEKSYYYDDAHGYEVYQPAANKEEKDEN